MTHLPDASGAATTIASDTAMEHWNATIASVLAHEAAAATHLSATLAAAPGFALGWAAKGLMILTLARAELRADAEAAHARAAALAAYTPPTMRERAYIDALRAWLADDPHGAAAHLDRAQRLDNRDILAAKLSHAIRFMAGDLAGMLSAARRHIRSYGEAGPHASYLLGMLSFAAEEAGQYAIAERAGRAAIEANPTDTWARHAVAHALEMTGRPRAGLHWLQAGRNHGAGLNNFGFHLSWHEALFQLELGDPMAALVLYDTEVRAQRTDDFRDIANAAALLQRLEFAGLRVGARWEELGELAARRIDDRRLVFADLHYALALAGAGRVGDLDRLATGLATTQGQGWNAMLSRREGAGLVEAVARFTKGDHAGASRLLLANRPHTSRIGGSHAQRDVMEQMLIESLIRAGDHQRARKILEERLAARGGQNLFAARRLAQLAPKTSPVAALSAALLGLMPSPAMH